MKEGFRLNELVAVEIMGEEKPVTDAQKVKFLYRTDNEYSANMSCAWKVVEKMYDLGYAYCLERASTAKKWTVHFMPKTPPEGGEAWFIGFVENMERISAKAKSLPEAICNAALACIRMK